MTTISEVNTMFVTINSNISILVHKSRKQRYSRHEENAPLSLMHFILVANCEVLEESITRCGDALVGSFRKRVIFAHISGKFLKTS